jgi:calcium permeable stress-gated cation channel
VIAISYSCIAPLTLGFATIGFSFLYLVFRYNLLYVLRTSIDTQGQAYAKALQQITVGVYLSELCLIGLFSLAVKRHRSSSGPLILMVVLTVLTVVYQRTMHKSLIPLTMTLPSNIVNQLHSEEDQDRYSERRPLLGISSSRDTSSGLKGAFLKFMEPQRYASYEIIYKALIRTRLGESVPPLSKDQERNAYLHPALKSTIIKIWVPKDKEGISDREIEETRKYIDITNEGAWIEDNGTIQWDKANLRKLPVWKDKAYY